MKMQLLLFAFFAAFIGTYGVEINGKNKDHAKSLLSKEEKSLMRIEDRCTTIIVGKNAGTEGPMASHTADCAECDFRINKVPAMDWPEGSMRPVYLYKNTYPSTVSQHRGKTWLPDNLEGNEVQLAKWKHESNITAYIPQVPHTYALYEAGYGIINEHQVAIGESTTAARFYGIPAGGVGAGVQGGKARIDVNELSRLALERTTTARDAILLMGKFAQELGYYCADWVAGGDGSLGEGGEALTVIDPNEAWVFHILSDDTGAGAIWAAQRVPADHVSVVANQFTIREIIPDSDDYLYSNSVFEVAKRNQLWESQEKDGYLNFQQTYGLPRAHSTYAVRRVWRVLSLVAPEAMSHVSGVPVDAWGSNFPFSVKAEKKISVTDVMNMHRDHYEGTEFDLTQGLAAGPYGDPSRFDPAPVDGMTYVESISGSYERAIGMYRTSYSVVSQARGHYPNSIGGRVWFSQANPTSAAYIPLYVAADTIPKCYSTGSLYKYDRDVAYWQFDSVGNYAARFYKYTIGDIKEAQVEVENALVSMSHIHDEAAYELFKTQQRERDNLITGTPGLASGLTVSPSTRDINREVTLMYNQFQQESADRIMNRWNKLFEHIMTKYHDGYIARGLETTQLHMEKLFYPRWWLNATGYFKSKINFAPGVIMFESDPAADGDVPTDSEEKVVEAPVKEEEEEGKEKETSTIPLDDEPSADIPDSTTTHTGISFFMTLFLCVATLCIGIFIGRMFLPYNAPYNSNNREYEMINTA